MSPDAFAKGWPRLRNHLLYIASRRLPYEAASEAVDDTLYDLLRVLPRLPDDQERQSNGEAFHLGKYARHRLRFHLMKVYARRQRAPVCLSLTQEWKEEGVEPLGLIERAMEAFQERERQIEQQGDVAIILQAARNEGDRQMLALLAEGYSPSDAARAMGVSRQCAHGRLKAIRERLAA